MSPAPAWRAIGVALLLLPFVPLIALCGPTPGSAGLVAPWDWLTRGAAILLAAWLAAYLIGPGKWPRLARGLQAIPGVAFCVVVLALVLASALLFRGHPLHLDSIVQMFQAQIFSSGRLTAPRPPDDAFFFTQNMILDETGWYSQYGPGHPALLAPGAWLGIPWLVPILLSLGTAVLLYRFTRLVYGEPTARVCLFALAASPFFWFMGASFMNHVPALFFTSLALYSLARWERDPGGRWLAAAGGSLGAVFLARPLTALAIGAALSPMVLVSRREGGEPDPGHRWRQVAAGAVGFGLVAGLYLAYNAATTGDVLTPGYLRLWGEGHGLGFHTTPWGGEHTPWLGLRNQLVDLSLLGVYLFESPLPGLLPIAVLFTLGWSERGWDRRLLACLLAVPIAYFFYWHRDDYLGPRFLYSTLAFLMPLTARSMHRVWSRLSGVDLTLRTMERAAPARTALAAVVALCLAYSAAWGIPQRFQRHAAGRDPLRQDLVAQARSSGIDHGLVFVSVSWGNRLIARLRAAGAPASLVERAYRTVDHCLLHAALEPPGPGSDDGRSVADRLRRLTAMGEDLVATPDLNGDPSLRLHPGRELSAACIEEIEYDRQGYGLYTPHLPANRPTLEGPFVIARDLRGENARLRAAFPHLPAYLLRAGDLRPLP